MCFTSLWVLAPEILFAATVPDLRGTWAGSGNGALTNCQSSYVNGPGGNNCTLSEAGTLTPSGDIPPPIVIPGTVSVPYDLDGDGNADIIWRNTKDGVVAIWLMNGSTIASFGFLGGVPTEWQIAGIGDVNGDDMADVIWRNSTNGVVAVWLMNGLTITSVGFPGSTSTDWKIERVGDVDGNGMADLVWRNTGSGVIAVWLMNGATIDSSGFLGGVPFEWQIAGIGDVNGDDAADVIWRNSTGVVAIWLMNGLTIMSVGFPASAPLDFTIAGIGDIDGNGTADVVWHNISSGGVALWLMNGTTLSSSVFIAGKPLEWAIAQIGDVDGAGKTDIIWFNTSTGEVEVWLMNGGLITSTGSPGSTSPSWKIQGGGTNSPLLSGLNFSPYLDGQDPNLRTLLSESQIRERMATIRPYIRWIRTFGCGDGLEESGRIAHQFGMKAAIGAWLGRNVTANQQQIDCVINVAKEGEADLVIVGSEALLRGDMMEAELVNAIKQVKQAIPEDIPVAYADVYGELLSHPNVVEAIDVVLANYYPYWEGIKVDLGVASIHAYHQQITLAAKGKPIIVSETGWPSDGDIQDRAIPSVGNACFYFQNFISWAEANQVDYFYFEAFDENWKAQYEGPQGAHWGIWDSKGTLKSCMQETLNGKRMADNWSGRDILGGPGTPTVTFTKVPPLRSFENLEGQVLHVKPADHRVAVYINVRGGWWTKPTFTNPLTSIQVDGRWVTDITTGGLDDRATTIIAFLLPKDFDPPRAAGSRTLPSELDQHALAKVEITRK